MIYCFDTYYFDDFAQTSCVGVESWESETVAFQLTESIDEIEDYESGSFYKRELPCLISILQKIDLHPKKDVLVIDGFVVLDDKGKPRLGAYLYEHLNRQIPVIGVAKNNFATINELKREVFRGESAKPLYVTAAGMDLNEASSNVANMHGDFRMPTILKLVDSYCRENPKKDEQID
ncbi:MAG: endonuclease V [Flavobacteriales bacterium]|nr:endonuclease V [Flavobacteriales bacterium]